MKSKLKKLNQQVIVITGASSGIGLATAQMAAKAGARVVLAARSQETLQDVVSELNRDGERAIYVPADVARESDVRRIARAAIHRFGGFDTWVNNAGVSIYGKLTDVPIEDQRRLFETNYWGYVYGSLVAVEHLKDKGGAIINVGSTVSDRALPLQGAYSASKHAVKGFTDALRMELEHDGIPISVTLVKPGAINTPYTEHAKNYMEVKPKHPGPVYAPEIVTEVILHAAQNPVRDVFAGAAGKALSMAERYAPRLTDRAMEAFVFNAQRSDKPASNRVDNGLERPSGEGRVSGDYEGRVAQTSVYTKGSLHPLITGGLLLAGAGLAYALIAARSKNGSTLGCANEFGTGP